MSIDVEEALSAPGVIAVLTGADVTADGLGGLPCGWMIHSKDGSEMKQPHHPVLADNRVHYLGEPVAMVIADTALEAKNAAELVVVDWAEKQAVVSVSEAQAGPAIYDDIPQNTCYEWALGDSDAVATAMERRLTSRESSSPIIDSSPTRWSLALPWLNITLAVTS